MVYQFSRTLFMLKLPDLLDLARQGSCVPGCVSHVAWLSALFTVALCPRPAVSPRSLAAFVGKWHFDTSVWVLSVLIAAGVTWILALFRDRAGGGDKPVRTK